MALNRRQTLSTLPSSYGNMNHSFREFGAENVPPHSKSKDRYSMAPYGSGKNGGFPPQKKDRSDSMGFYNSNRLSGKRQSINFPKESNGRQSIAQGSRRSSVHNRKISQQDPRPVGDKKYTSEMIKNLIAFLTTHQFPQEISQKMLTCPSTQQFVDISEFLLQHLDPEFKFSHWQHELPEMFQMLGYGVKIKPHALKNVGSPHAWPTLLAALTWLIELLNYREGDEMMNDNQNDELLQNEANPDRVFFDYLARSYERYIRGADIEEIENNLFQLCEERAAEIRNDITDLERDIEHTKADIADHENLKKEYQKKLIEHQDLSRDASRFEQALKKLDSIRESHALQLRQTQERALQIESECAVLEKTKHQLIDQIESQDVSIEDYSRMLKEVELMKESLKQLTKEEEQVKSNNWEVDREVYVLIEEIEKKVYEFNEKAAGLQLIPSSAKNAQGKNFKLEFDRSAEPLKSFNLDLKSDLKPALLRLRTKYEEGNRQSLDEKRDIGDRIRKLEEVQQEKSEDIRMNQEKLAKFEQTYEDEYKKFNRITKENISKVEDLELENIKNQNLFSDRLKEAESTLQQLDIEMAQVESTFEEEESELKLQIVSVMEFLLEHKSSIQKRIDFLKENMAEKLQALHV